MKELVVIEKPNSTFGEQMKKVRTNLMFSNLDDDMKVIMITSSIPGEGKSFISSNLAAAFAQANESTLLIDCDLRKGRLKKIFNIPPEEKGLSELLINKNWQEEYIKYINKTDVNKLFVMTCGVYPPNPSELLASDKFKDLLDVLKKNFQIIILDCPPIAGLNDAFVLAKKSDRCVLVANCEKTTMDTLEKSVNELQKMDVKISGIILNDSDIKNNKYYYYGHYYRDEKD
ncbi:MAG: CpsD/CapB family tyrosine-protein kinase [Bacilli bacterium]|nr:CpsD/CapB family tyrosine-protein kinase [Bacilli bacterium]